MQQSLNWSEVEESELDDLDKEVKNIAKKTHKDDGSDEQPTLVRHDDIILDFQDQPRPQIANSAPSLSKEEQETVTLWELLASLIETSPSIQPAS